MMRLVIVTFLLSFALHAQTVDTPIVDQTPEGIKKSDAQIIDRVREMAEAKQLLSHDEVLKQLAAPKPAAIDLTKPTTQARSPEEISEIGRKGNLRVGYCFLCTKCDHWHLNMAGGYAIAKDVVVTCDHVVDTESEIREGYLIVVDADNHVHAVTSVMARSKVMDAAILHIKEGNFTPLALNDQVKQGALAYCYSSPMGQTGYFSDGIVNRFFWDREYRGGDKQELLASRYLRVNFSTDWAPGSSGSAVLDASGHVIGHVSQISSLGKGKGAPAFVTLHTGIPAFSVKRLVTAMSNEEELKALLKAEQKKTTPSKTNAAPKKKAA